jgi:hypothetical protein
MNTVHDDTIAELEAVTAEMAALQDLAGARLNDLLDRRGILIRRLIATDWDTSDSRLASIVANAAELQERLQKHADSVRGDLLRLESAGVLMGAVRSTLAAPQSNSIDIRV